MISSLRNFAKTKFAGLLVFIMIIPFVFWGMGGMFSSGNTNNIAKINNNSISTEDFIDYINKSGIPEKTIRENLEQNIIEEILSGLVSTTLLDLEIKDFDLTISEVTLLKKIKENKNFRDENGVFQRIKYEKFLLENNLSAPGFEQRLKLRELQRNLFDYIGAGTTSPQFLTTKLFKEENQKLEIEFIDLNDFYVNKNDITDKELENFINDNKDELKIEYLDFSYTIINPKNLIGVDDFNQSFFDKIDEIEVAISNEIDFKTITSNFDLKSVDISNFRFSTDKNEIEKKIYELRNNKFDIFENKNDYILYNIKNITQKSPDLSDKQIKEEVLKLVFQKNKFDYNQKLLNEINFIKKDSGGSVANTLAAISLFGGDSCFCGKVKNDDLGNVFVQSMEKVGTKFLCQMANNGLPTARCIVMVTSDGERTMQTFLGASTTLEKDDLTDSFFDNIDYVLIEGYLWSSPSAREAINKAVDISKNRKLKIIFSLFC